MNKTYNFKATCMSGRQGETKVLNSESYGTQELIRKGFIQEVKVVAEMETKVVEPAETKAAKPKAKAKAKSKKSKA